MCRDNGQLLERLAEVERYLIERAFGLDRAKWTGRAAFVRELAAAVREAILLFKEGRYTSSPGTQENMASQPAAEVSHTNCPPAAGIPDYDPPPWTGGLL